MPAVLGAATPVTMPDDVPTVAFAGLALDQLPPVGDPVRVVVAPWHTLGVPDIVGFGFTVTTTVAAQPVPSV